ncbi:MAG: TonB-dependent receptor, partial [Acidobacteriota bacterium]|nr:TonB-dependent receptor [Acidobacteriota bacterium]
ATPPPTSAGPSFPRINGGRPRVNEYLYDGISALQPEPGQVAFSPIVDAIQEFKVEINSPAAEFGRFNGGVVNLTTKSGTNSFRGSVFYFLRNEVLNARNLFAPPNAEKPVFRRNQYGFVSGGPIIRDKTFFFGDFQGTRQLVGRVLTSTVPTLAQRQGIFTQAVFDPATTRPRVGGGFIRDQFLNNRIPMSRIDPIALQLLQRYPLPTSSASANNYTRVANEAQAQDQFDVRVDHRFTERAKIFGRYSFFTETFTPVTPLPEGSGNVTQGALGLQDTRAHQFVGNYVRVFSPSVVNELRFGYTRRSIDRRAGLLDAPPSESLRLPGIPQNAAFQNELPTFQITGLQQLGPTANTNSQFSTDVTQIFDAVGVQHGRHSMKFGVDFRLERLNVLQPPSPTGNFAFNTLGTNQPGTTNTGNAFASFLLGKVQNFSIDLQQDVIRPRARILEFFAQDDFKATSRLTLNLGLRYTLNFPSTETTNQGAIFNLQTQQLDYLGQNNYPDTGRELHKLNFGPRVGLAYRLTDCTVVRAGYGLIWQEQAGITTPFTVPQFPFIQTVTQRSLDGVNPAFVLSTGPNVQSIPLTPDAGLGLGVFAVDRELGSGYVQQ